MPFAETVNPPGAASYSAPLLNFAQFGQWANDFQQGQANAQQRVTNDQQQQLNQQRIAQGQRQQEIDTLFSGGLPKDAQGNIDYQKVAAMLAQKGDISAITQLKDLIQQTQAANTPELPPPATGGATPQGGGPQPSSVQARPLPAPAANSPKGDPGQGTLVDLVTDKLPSQNQTTGQTIAKIAEVMGVDPNATLTPGQITRAQGLLKKYAPDIATGSPLPPSANAGSPAPTIAPAQPQPQPAAVQPQQAQPQPQQPQAAPQPAPQGGPITPQVPLLPGYTDPQQAILALNRRAAQLEAANPKMKPKADDLRAWASRIEDSIKPVDVTSMTTRLDPRTGKPLYQGPGATAIANAAAGTGATIDADAERYRQTGTLPPNMGRGVQGEAEARAIRARAAELEIQQGGDPSKWPDRWQDYRAAGIGKNTAERTKASREENLNLILKAADAAIPAALEASKALPRSDFVPLNKLIQGGQVMTSNPKLLEFGMANLQLAEHWARAMNPTGVMRESDRDKALSFLSTAYGNSTYERAVMQLQKQITRERDAVRGGGTSLPKEGSVQPGGADKDGWVAAPNGALIREVK